MCHRVYHCTHVFIERQVCEYQSLRLSWHKFKLYLLFADKNMWLEIIWIDENSSNSIKLKSFRFESVQNRANCRQFLKKFCFDQKNQFAFVILISISIDVIWNYRFISVCSNRLLRVLCFNENSKDTQTNLTFQNFQSIWNLKNYSKMYLKNTGLKT